MATDINTQLQNISTDVTAIGNVVNRLLTIFSGGGVANPDIAVAKAGIEANIATNYVPKSLNVVSSGYLTLRQLNVTENMQFISAADNSSLYGGFYLLRNNNINHMIFRIYGSNNTTYHDVHFFYESGVPSESGARFIVPTAPITSTWGDAINRQFLDNLGNSVVHKTGYEEIIGDKYRAGTDFKKASSFNYYILDKNNITLGENPSTTTYLASTIIAQTTDFSSQRLYNDDVRMYANGSVGCIRTLFSPRDTSKYAQISLNVNSNEYCFINMAGDVAVYGDIFPGGSNHNIGKADHLWSTIYAGSGTINTSDERLKTEIQDIPVVILEAWGECSFKQFKFKDAVEKKGSAARIHFGGIAQQFKNKLEARGIDPTKYGFFCYDEWEDQYEEVQVLVEPEVKQQVKVVDAQELYDIRLRDDGSEEKIIVSPEKFHMEDQVVKEAVYRTEKKLVKKAGNQYSLRYEEMLVLEAAYQRYELNKIKTKLNV